MTNKIKTAYNRFSSGLKEESAQLISMVDRRQSYVDILCDLATKEGLTPNVSRIRAVVNSNSAADIERIIDAIERFGITPFDCKPTP